VVLANSACRVATSLNYKATVDRIWILNCVSAPTVATIALECNRADLTNICLDSFVGVSFQDKRILLAGNGLSQLASAERQHKNVEDGTSVVGRVKIGEGSFVFERSMVRRPAVTSVLQAYLTYDLT
jgi:hypothetical protein